MKKLVSYSLIAFTTISILFSCSKDDDGGKILSSEKQLNSFQLLADDNTNLAEDVTDFTINKSNNTITATLPYGTDITNIHPTIVVSGNATISPTGAQDFSNPITYTITAEDKTKATYTVTINVALNDEKKINSFAFLAANNTALSEDATATIDETEKTITLNVPANTNVTALTPSIEFSDNATINLTEAQDFTNPVEYIVTAQDGTTVTYTVTVNIILSQREVLIKLYNDNPENKLNWDITSENISSWNGVTTDSEGNVTKLSLSSKNIHTLPNEIGNLDQLTQLKLHQNQLTKIPTEIANLNQLTQLWLHNNQLTTIPNQIGLLPNLTKLYLDQNQLTEIPNQIGNLTQLTELYLYDNQLTEIPNEIGNLTQLTGLSLSRNQLTEIPNQIGNLTNLTVLYLYDNQLTEIPNEIGNLTQLTQLWLHNNNLSSLPQAVCDLNINDLEIDLDITPCEVQ